MNDPYLYDNVPVLKNKFKIMSGETLDLIEAEQSRANIMLLYEQGFADFSSVGLCYIHHFLFGDIYEWAGEYRIMNIQKSEVALGGRSVWYSNDDDIEKDLNAVFTKIEAINWDACSKEDFVDSITRLFPEVWTVHPFREGNTRTVIMFMNLFVEAHGFYLDMDLLASSARYVRDSFVMASIGEHSELYHLREILTDAICDEPMQITAEGVTHKDIPSKYQKYARGEYIPAPHTVRDDEQHCGISMDMQ